jgi:hypothetical protein
MAAELTILTHKIAIQLHILAESCTVCSYRSRWPVRKILDTPSYSTQEAPGSAFCRLDVDRGRFDCHRRLPPPFDASLYHLHSATVEGM